MITEPSDGAFPFGRHNTVRPARIATGKPRAAVIGVYPSAWHVSWRAPSSAKSPQRTGAVAALAVDVEPTVFWDGAADDFSARLDAWCAAVGFKAGDAPGQHGHISRTSPATNGSSGRTLIHRYLEPLGIEETSVTFTDIYPVFFVKYSSDSSESPREQGDAIRQEYDSIVDQLGTRKASLPPRPSHAKLPRLAAARFSKRIVDDLVHASADLVITLGAEVWKALVLIPELRAQPPCADFEGVYGPLYGSTGSLSICGRNVTWLPLVHPGLLKGAALEPDSDVDPRTRTIRGWNILHSRWARSCRPNSAVD